jgi:hypothetical protein
VLPHEVPALPFPVYAMWIALLPLIYPMTRETEYLVGIEIGTAT